MTCRVIDSLDGPVVLVGHSYGGAVITEAGKHEKRELRQERKIPYPKAALRRKEGRKEGSNTIADRDLEALRAAIAALVAGQAGYDQARQAWNLAVDQQPLCCRRGRVGLRRGPGGPVRPRCGWSHQLPEPLRAAEASAVP